MPTKRGSSWQGTVYHASLPAGRARRAFETKNEAEAWELDSKARIKRGEPIDLGGGEKARIGGRPYTLTELVDHVYATHWKSMASGHTQLVAVRELVALIGPSMPIAKVGKLEIDRARAKLLDTGNQPATVNRKVAALSKCLTEAVRAGLIETKPHCAKYKESEHRIRVISADEERTLLAYCERMGDVDLGDYIVWSIDTGMRQGEVLAVETGDIEGGRVRVWGQSGERRSKSGKSRVIPLTKRCIEIADRRRAKGKLFPSLAKRSIHYRWEKMTEALDLVDDKEFVPHAMRHTFCSRLARRGAQAPTIMALAGHSALHVSQRYIHMDGASLDDAIGTLDAPVVEPEQDMSATQLLSLLTRAGVDVKSLLAKALEVRT